MKRFTKIALIIAGIMVGIGVICMIVSFAMGMTGETFIDMVNDGKFSFGDTQIFEAVVDEGSVEIDSPCSCLEVELSAGTLEISYSDVEKIQIFHENVKNFEAYVDDEVLHIEADKRVNNSDGIVVITIPQGERFVEADIELGAGQADIDGLQADALNIEVGAGQANITNLDVNQFYVETGAGKVCAELVGSMDDYNCNLECGIGEIRVGNESFRGLGSHKKIQHHDSKRSIDAECGVGQIEIDFVE